MDDRRRRESFVHFRVNGLPSRQYLFSLEVFLVWQNTGNKFGNLIQEMWSHQRPPSDRLHGVYICRNFVDFDVDKVFRSLVHSRLLFSQLEFLL